MYSLSLFRFDARGTSKASFWTAPAPFGFGRRARFDPHSAPAALRVTGVSLEDAGVFRCRVDFRKSQTRNSLVNVSLIVPATPPVITDARTGRAITPGGVAGPFDEGVSLNLACRATHGTPLPSLVWYSMDGDVVDDTFSTSEDDVRNTLRLATLTKKHFGKSFYCEAKNNDETSPAKTNVTIDMRCKKIKSDFFGPRKIFRGSKIRKSTATFVESFSFSRISIPSLDPKKKDFFFSSPRRNHSITFFFFPLLFEIV